MKPRETFERTAAAGLDTPPSRLARRWLPALLAGLASAFLAACGLEAGQETGLTIYTARDKNLAETVVRDFEAKHPEFAGQIAILTIGAQEALERVRAERVNPQADLWWGGTSRQLSQAAEEGLLARAPKTAVDAVPARHRDANGLWLGEMLLPEVIVFNHDMIAPSAAPTSWDDLVSPAMKGRIVIRDVESSGTMRGIFAAMIDRQVAATGSAEAGYAWLKRLDANTKVYAANPTDLYLRIARGEAAYTVWNLQDIMLQIHRQRAPFTPVVPREGVPMLVDGLAKIRNGPSPAAADAFIAFLMSEPIQSRLAEEYFQVPTRQLQRQPQWLGPIGLKEMQVDWERAAREEQGWISHWATRIKGRG